MSEQIRRVTVILTRIVSPTEFWFTKPTTDDHSDEPCPYSNTDFNKQKTYRQYLQWIKDRSEQKCHLAFLIPIDSICWTSTAIEKFKSYANRYEEYALSMPDVVQPLTKSTAVILWGLMRQQSDTSDEDDAHVDYVWQNINLQMIYQGVARSVVHIKHLSAGMPMPRLNANDFQKILTVNHIKQHQYDVEIGKRAFQWLPAAQCQHKEFTGTPVFIDSQLTIYVQEWENRKCIKFMSEMLTEWHRNCVKNPRKFWNKGDICVAQRNSDGMYHRAKVQKVRAKQQKCLVEWVDFGYTERVHFDKLSTHIDFIKIPIQVIKCHLSNVIPISDDQTEQAKELCCQLILNELCVIYIHDIAGIEQHKSNACNIQSLNASLDLSSLLISQGLVQHKAHSYGKLDNVIGSPMNWKRIRTESDEPIIKNSSELHNYQDFKAFFRSHKAINPMDDMNISHANGDINDDGDDDDVSRIFEIFEPPSKRCSSEQRVQKRRTILPVEAPHPIVDRITKHFRLMHVEQPVFECRCVYIMDPVTLLIELPGMKPVKIDRINEQQENFPLEEYSPVIAYKDYGWRRGIVWEKLSTNKYSILFVDTLQIVEVHRNYIQKCSTEYLGTILPYAKVHLWQIKANERWRAEDICFMLDEIIMNKDLIAHVIAWRDNGVLEVKLYDSQHAKQTIYHHLTKQKFYKRI